MNDQDYKLFSKMNFDISRIADSLEGISAQIDDMKTTAVGPIVDIVKDCRSALREIETNTIA